MQETEKRPAVQEPEKTQEPRRAKSWEDPKPGDLAAEPERWREQK